MVVLKMIKNPTSLQFQLWLIYVVSFDLFYSFSNLKMNLLGFAWDTFKFKPLFSKQLFYSKILKLSLFSVIIYIEKSSRFYCTVKVFDPRHVHHSRNLWKVNLFNMIIWRNITQRFSIELLFDIHPSYLASKICREFH